MSHAYAVYLTAFATFMLTFLTGGTIAYGMGEANLRRTSTAISLVGLAPNSWHDEQIKLARRSNRLQPRLIMGSIALGLIGGIIIWLCDWTPLPF